MGEIFKIIGEVVPVAVELIQHMINLPDKEFEEISKAWPSPTRSKLAKIRAEMKARDHFLGGTS